MKSDAEGARRGQPLFQKVASQLEQLVRKGTYRPGERAPSVRALSRQLRVSINTILHAYEHLENRGILSARPQSGYYIRSRLVWDPPPHQAAPPPPPRPRPVNLTELAFEILREVSNPARTPLASAAPNPELLPVDKLNRILASQTRRHRLETISRTPSRGLPALRAQIARRSLESGCPCSPEEVLVTSGCRESLALALRAVCRPGDTVAVQSPVFFTFLESLHAAGLKALEIPCSAQKGLRLDILRSALRTTNIRACLIIPTCNNPLGNTLPEEQTRELVSLLQQHEVPLIEDDVYADLAFGAQRARAARAFDRKGLVLLCSSFSKSLAPGYQVGWILPGRFQDKIERLKALLNTATASPSQLALAEFLANGGYNHYLRRARRSYQQLMLQTREAVLRSFPAGTRVNTPDGGFVLWVELPETVDAVELYRHALAQSITILPGQLFTTGKGYRNCIRLNTTFWSPRTESAIQTLGTLASNLAGAAASR